MQASDGQRLTNFLQYASINDDEPADVDSIIEDIKILVKELEEMAAAPALDEYAGPVLFTDFAASQIISKLFVSQLSPVKPFLTAEDWLVLMVHWVKWTRRICG